MFYFVTNLYRKLLEGEESRLSVGGAVGVSSLYSHGLSAPAFVRPVLSTLSSGPSYLMTSRLLGSSTAEAIVSSGHAQKAEASPPAEEEEEGGEGGRRHESYSVQLNVKTSINNDIFIS